MIRIAVVDDDTYQCDGLRSLIDRAEDLCCVCTAGSAEDALKVLWDHPTDVLLLDIGLPGILGSAAVTLFRAAFPSMAILMLTVYSEREKVFASICNGACGYLLKSTSPAQLLDALRTVHAGGSPLSPEIASNIVRVFQQPRPAISPDTALSPQEKALLSLLAQGYSYEAAGRQINVSVNTIRNYIRSIYDKLHVHSKAEAVTTALRQGLLG